MRKKLLAAFVAMSMLTMTTVCYTNAAATATTSETYAPQHFNIPEIDFTSETSSNWVYTYTYDEHNNRLTMDSEGGRSTSAPQITHTEYTYEYDEDGKILTRTDGETTSTYEYDENGNCSKMTNTYSDDTSDTYEYSDYDANGNYCKEVALQASLWVRNA